VSFALRLQFLEYVNNDLHFVESLSDSDGRLIKMACEQVAYTAVKHSEAKDEARINVGQLAEVKRRIDEIGNLIVLSILSLFSKSFLQMLV